MTALFGLCIQYSDWGITDTPRDCSMLMRVFAFCGLDMEFCWLFGVLLWWIFCFETDDDYCLSGSSNREGASWKSSWRKLSRSLVKRRTICKGAVSS